MMTQAIQQLDGCKHGYVPGKCIDPDCRNSLRAKLLYSPARLRLRRFYDSGMLLDPAKILTGVVASDYMVTPEELLGKCRLRHLMEARKALYYVCRHATEPQWSYPQIGGSIGNRDHTTVMHGIASLSEQMGRDEALNDRVRLLVVAARGALAPIPDLEVSE